MSTKTYVLLYHKKIAKETAFSHNNQPEKDHHGIVFLCVGKEWCVTAT
jgi:hypothetical protein